MEYFESPAWDGDKATENLTTELFGSSNVGEASLMKKKKRNKHPKGASKDVTTDQIKFSEVVVNLTQGKGNSTESSDARIGKGVLQKKCNSSRRKKNKLKFELEEVNGRMQCKSNVKSEKRKERFGARCSKGNDSHPNFSPEPSPPITQSQRSNKRKRKKAVSACNLASYPVGSHNFKALKDQLDLIVSKSPVYKDDVNNKDIIVNSLIGKKIGATAGKIFHEKKLNESAQGSKSGDMIKEKGKKSEAGAGRHCKVEKNTKQKSGLRKNEDKEMAGGKLSVNVVTPHITKGSQRSDVEGAVIKKRKNRSGRNKSIGKELLKNVCDISVGKKEAMHTSDAGKKRKHLEGKESLKKKMKRSEKIVEETDKESEEGDSCTKQMKKIKCSGNEINLISDSENNASVSVEKKNLSLREKMLEKLRGARFRYMNEEMYTSRSDYTSKLFQADPNAFKAYHDGYKQQLMLWPVKPIDLIIKSLKKRPSTNIIADFGCGDAQISRTITNKVYSFDHVALNKHVTTCDMAHTLLPNASVDVVVFCLSLMGKNISDYIFEANRVLKIGGLLKIAEIESRFDEVEKFVKDICKFGFLCIRRDLSNDLFYLFDFRKEKSLTGGNKLPKFELRPCIYKKR